MDILAGTGNIVQNFSYTYDVLGNVLTRADANENLSETFTYDNLNRVTSATVSQSVAPVKTFTYDLIGNLLSKSDVGAYAYPLAGSALPHAVMSISGGALTSSFMMSADPFVPDPMNGQASNRYSYVINNPLALTDPNGYCFLGMCTWGNAKVRPEALSIQRVAQARRTVRTPRSQGSRM